MYELQKKKLTELADKYLDLPIDKREGQEGKAIKNEMLFICSKCGIMSITVDNTISARATVKKFADLVKKYIPQKQPQKLNVVNQPKVVVEKKPEVVEEVVEQPQPKKRGRPKKIE